MGKSLEKVPPGDKRRAIGRHGNSVGAVNAASAEVGGVRQDRVNDERPAWIVLTYLKCHIPPAPYQVPDNHRLSSAIGRFLVSERPVQRDLTACDARHQVTLRVDSQVVDALKCQPDDARVGPGRNDEITFELALGAVINQVDSGINSQLRDFAVIWNAAEPVGRIFAEKVIALARQLVHTHHAGRGIAANHLHS